MPEKTNKQIERDKLSQDAAKELKKMKELANLLKRKLPLPQQESALQRPYRKKKKKKPLGTKGGKGKPARTEKPGVPHGVDMKDQEGTTILEVATGGSVHPPKQKRGNYGPNKGKPFKAMGPVGGLPVNKSGTKIMAGKGRKGLKQLKTIAKSIGVPGATAGMASGIGKLAKKLAGRLATRGYGKARK